MDNRPPDPGAWLEPSRWDRLPVLGTGAWSRVLAAGRYALKVAHPAPQARAALRREVENYAAVKETPAAALAPRLLAARPDARAHLRERLRGASLLELLRAGRHREVDWTAFGEAHARCEAHFELTGQRLDFSPSNLFFRRGTFVLCDLGDRLASSPFEGCPPGDLAVALERYLAQRDALEAGVQPFLPPPSARFHVEVGVGPVRGARLLWRNDRLADLMDLDAARLLQLANVSTEARRRTRTCVATRYQDGPRKKDAHGDGRVVFVAQVLRGPNGDHRYELSAKGVGPTPLTWRGMQYHEDGRVSLSRTLWEAAVCDELDRLGFEAPRILAVVSTDADTVDNTDRSWPAAVALRMSSTHYRAGHLHRVDNKPDELRDLLAHIGARVQGPGFDPDKAAHVERFFWRFTETLAHDVGRTEALNIRCFNPTMGNVRLDGHLIDFSTVRFFEHTFTDFVFMNGRRLSREHTATLRRHANELLACLRRGKILDEDRYQKLKGRLPLRFERAHFRGYLAGVSSFLGVDLVNHANKRRASALVRTLRRLRNLRAPGTVEFPFWGQRCRAPLFDLEHKAAAWLSTGDPFALASGETLDAFAAHLAREAWAHLDQLVDLDEATPKTWPEIVRPIMELERLADLCYQRSSPEDLDEWTREVSR